MGQKGVSLKAEGGLQILYPITFNDRNYIRGEFDMMIFDDKG